MSKRKNSFLDTWLTKHKKPEEIREGPSGENTTQILQREENREVLQDDTKGKQNIVTYTDLCPIVENIPFINY